MSAWWVPPTLRGYQRSWLLADALAGLTLVAIALPSQMATARLANLPAVAGLYAFIAGSVLYALIGTNSHLSVGADSTIAPVLAVSVASVAAVGSPHYASVMAFTSILVGALLIAVGVLRMGWISEFLSTPVITGALAGIAIAIAVRQLPVVLGLTGGGTTTIGRVRRVVDHLGHTNGWSVAIAVGVLTVIVGAQRINHRLPGALVGLVLSIVAVDVLGLASHHGVAVLGTVHGGLPHVGLPSASWSEFRRMIAPVLTIAFVCVAQTAATIRAARPGGPATDDFNQDLIGVGAGSVAAALIGGFAVDASPPNTAIVGASGARSQLTNILAAVVVLVVVLVATRPLSHLPQATLGATLLFVATRLFRVRDLRNILRFDLTEFVLALATLVVVALLGIEQGVILAIVLSLADRTRRTARPRDTILGREPGTDHWIPTDVGKGTEQVPGILVYQVSAPLWYGNADYIRLRISDLVDAAPAPVHAVIFDAAGISDIDYTGLQSFRGLAAELNGRGITIRIARASHLVHHDLKHGAVLQRLGPDLLYNSVAEAVTAVEHHP
jgi:SulP family sulfate permease